MWRYTKDKTATWRIPKGSPSAGVYRVQADGDWEMEPHFEEDLFAENPDVRRNWEAVAHCKKSIAYELMRLRQVESLYDTETYVIYAKHGFDPSSRPFLFDISVDRTHEVQIVSFFNLNPIDLFRYSEPNRFKSDEEVWHEYNGDGPKQVQCRRDFELLCSKVREEQAIQIQNGWIRLDEEGERQKKEERLKEIERLKTEASQAK